MDSLNATVAGVRLTPYFQKYVQLERPDELAGELLTKPEVSRQTEEFFTALTTDEQFEVLEWQVLVCVCVCVVIGSGRRSPR